MRAPIETLHYAHECEPSNAIGQAAGIALRMLLCRTRPTVRNKNFKRLLAGVQCKLVGASCSRSRSSVHLFVHDDLVYETKINSYDSGLTWASQCPLSAFRYTAYWENNATAILYLCVQTRRYVCTLMYANTYNTYKYKYMTVN